jgi:hypothetical protein
MKKNQRHSTAIASATNIPNANANANANVSAAA